MAATGESDGEVDILLIVEGTELFSASFSLSPGPSVVAVSAATLKPSVAVSVSASPSILEPTKVE